MPTLYSIVAANGPLPPTSPPELSAALFSAARFRFNAGAVALAQPPAFNARAVALAQPPAFNAFTVGHLRAGNYRAGI